MYSQRFQLVNLQAQSLYLVHSVFLSSSGAIWSSPLPMYPYNKGGTSKTGPRPLRKFHVREGIWTQIWHSNQHLSGSWWLPFPSNSHSWRQTHEKCLLISPAYPHIPYTDMVNLILQSMNCSDEKHSFLTPLMDLNNTGLVARFFLMPSVLLGKQDCNISPSMAIHLCLSKMAYL